MGFKRPFNGDELQGLTFKQARAQCNDKMNRFADTLPLSVAQKFEILDEESLIRASRNSDGNQHFEVNVVPRINIFSKDMNESASLHLISTSLSFKDSEAMAARDPNFSEYFSHDNISRKISLPPGEVYLYYLCHPRKQVPVGADHQAELPECNAASEVHGQATEENPNCKLFSVLEHASSFEKKEFVGECVISPDGDDIPDAIVGCGKKICNCGDMDSVRCARQHIMEAREKLRISIGHEKFVGLGFYEMGEEVACHWSEEEERVFHRVVFSNPASLGFNFWKFLSEVFPFRTTKEIVSYYFNVFMLRRRASQNRSETLDIDSDDDEWPGFNRKSCKPLTEEDNPNACGSSDGDENAGEECELKRERVERGSGAGEYSFQDDSCMSFAGESVCDGGGKGVTSGSDGGQIYLLDACETKMWDSQCPGTAKEVELLPTCNMIEEIFGRGSSNRDD